MSFDNAYESLIDDNDETHWAYGTGFTDPLSDVDRAVPDGVDAASLATYCLMLGDDALVMAQRLSAWCSWAPELEEDVALANIALDLLGQARLLYVRAVEVNPSIRPANAPAHVPAEDALAYFRDEPDFRNVRLAEIDTGPGPAGDFAMTIARLLVFASWRLALFTRLADATDPVLAAIAAKGVKELTYHRDHAAQWTVRLRDLAAGTGTLHATCYRRCATCYSTGRRGRAAGGPGRRAGPGVRRRRAGAAGRAGDGRGQRPDRARWRAHHGVGLSAGRTPAHRAVAPAGGVVMVDLAGARKIAALQHIAGWYPEAVW